MKPLMSDPASLLPTSPLRLADLNPKLEGTLNHGLIRFDCPRGHGHKFRIPIHAGAAGPLCADDPRAAGMVQPWVWHAEGAFPGSLTLTPSVDASDPLHPSCEACGWHGHITNGEIR